MVEVMVVLLMTEVVVVKVGGAVQALGRGQRAVVEVTLAAEGGALHLDEVAEVGRDGVLLAVRVVVVGSRALRDGRSGEGTHAAGLRPDSRLTLGRAAGSVPVVHGVRNCSAVAVFLQ